MPRLKCLSIRQPWCELILSGRKKVENRSWRTNYRGPLGIHASTSEADLRELSDDEIKRLCPAYLRDGLWLGRVLGMAELVDCCRYRDLPAELKGHEFAHRGRDNWCWILRRARRLLKPRLAIGKIGFFYVTIPPTYFPANAASLLRRPVA